MRSLCCFVLHLCLAANVCFAGSLSKGDVIRLDRGNGAVSGTAGGEFSIWKQVGGNWEFIGKTFCVEISEFVSLGSLYKVGGVSDRAVFGGGVSGDILDQTTKFLYNSYSNGTLASYGTGFTYGNVNSVDALQYAIWAIEGERALTGTGNDILAQTLINLATAQVATNPTSDFGVFVLNLFDISTPDALLSAFDPLNVSTWSAVSAYKKQDQLYYVPEPASVTIFALGFTLAGAYRVRSRFRTAKKQVA